MYKGRFTANTHSFNVYTYANEDVKQSIEVQTFKEKIVLVIALGFDIEIVNPSRF